MLATCTLRTTVVYRAHQITSLLPSGQRRQDWNLPAFKRLSWSRPIWKMKREATMSNKIHCQIRQQISTFRKMHRIRMITRESLVRKLEIHPATRRIVHEQNLLSWNHGQAAIIYSMASTHQEMRRTCRRLHHATPQTRNHYLTITSSQSDMVWIQQIRAQLVQINCFTVWKQINRELLASYMLKAMLFLISTVGQLLLIRTLLVYLRAGIKASTSIDLKNHSDHNCETFTQTIPSFCKKTRRRSKISQYWITV